MKSTDVLNMDLSKVACVLAGESEGIKSPADDVSRIKGGRAL